MVDRPAPNAVRDLLLSRWSPRRFSDRSVPADVLRACFEAARWAPSSFNEQPWRFLVATRDDLAAFERMASCLNERNQSWATSAPVLVLTAARTTFSRNDRTNAYARYDLGQAVAQLVTQATAYGVYAHQMAGILPDRARDMYGVPPEFDVVTAMALGYLPHGEAASDTRTRRALDELVFAEAWAQPPTDIR